MTSKRIVLLAIALGSLLLCVAVTAIGVVTTLFLRRALTPAEWGPDYASPGLTLSLDEVNRTGEPGETQVGYSLTTTGVPPGDDYSLWRLDLGSNEPWQWAESVTVDDDGAVTVHSENQEYSSVAAVGFVRGQRFQVALMNADESIRVFASVFPFPIEASGEGGCRVWVELGALDASMFYLHAEGFQPGEPLVFGATPRSDLGNSRSFADEAGSYLSIEYPGQLTGRTHYTVTGANCSASVSYERGPGALDVQ
jgi:hypothetical protein